MSGVVSKQLGGSLDGCCWSRVALMCSQMCVVVPDTLFEDRVIREGLYVSVVCWCCAIVSHTLFVGLAMV